MKAKYNAISDFLSHALIHRGMLRKLRKSFLMKVSKINHPIFHPMNKTATVLSAREIEVLEYIAQGMNNHEIAKVLELSIHTVANHRKNMLSRSRCNNCTELVRIAVQEGVI